MLLILAIGCQIVRILDTNKGAGGNRHAAQKKRADPAEGGFDTAEEMSKDAWQG